MLSFVYKQSSVPVVFGEDTIFCLSSNVYFVCFSKQTNVTALV